MAIVAALPNTLRDKINSLARKMALLRLTRAIAVTALILIVSAGLIWAADYWLKLPRGVRLGMLGCWAALAIAGFVRCVKNLSHKADADALAALIEQEYPNLAERLLTSVELTEAAENAHGSQTFIELLVRETEIRTSSLNFLQAAPEKPTFRLVTIAFGIAALLLIPAAIWPHSYSRQVKRFFLPWQKTVVPYEVVTNPGDYAIARGHSLILTANVRSSGDADSLPTSATLYMTGVDGRTSRLGMKSDQPQIFYVKVNSVNDSFAFKVESGDAVSEEHQVTAVDPVQLTADSPRITVAPPAYAQKAQETKTFTGLGDFSALQHGKLSFQFRFSKPAQKAILEWTPASEGDKQSARSMQHTLQLADGGQTARIELPVRKSGRFSLVLEAEHAIRTELPPQALNVIVDRPPAFVKVSGTTEQIRSVNAFETVPLELTLADDYGVETADVEYRVNEGKIQTEAMNLEGLGSPQAVGAYPLKLSGKVKEGDTFQFRLRIADNRRVPEAKLAPQVVYHPTDNRWFTLKIARAAEPLKQQEIVAQRDDIRKRLDALIDDLKGERRRIYKTQQEARREQKLTAEANLLMKDLRKEHQGNERTLSDLARDVALTPDLKSLSNRLQDVGDQEMHNASAALQQAEKERAASNPRDKELVKADQDIENAIKKLEDLQKQNDQIAQQRLDQMRLEQLAERQQQLAEQLAKETDPQKAQQIAQEQKRLKEELKQTTEQSEQLKQALDAAQAEKNKELADKARELAQAQRDLQQAMKQTDQEANKDLLSDLAKKQKELAARAEQLARQTEQPSKAAQTRPLDAEKPKEAADALEKGDAGQALTKQEQTAQDLDRLANDLDRAIQLAKDPREAARQLARLQDDLKNRTADEHKKTPLAAMPHERLDELRKEQQAIKLAAETLPVPETNKDAQRDKQQAVEHALKAAEELAKKNQRMADAHMAEAREALLRLSDKLPTLAQRLSQAREEVARLRQQQTDIARQAEQAVRQAEQQKSANPEQARRDLAQKLNETAQKQADIADKLGKLDVPNHEERQQRSQDAANNALQDLMSARAQDIPASQSEAKRQLERLEQALNGQKAVDEKAAELARRQEKVADQAAKLARNETPADQKAREMQNLQNQQRQIAQEAAALPRTEALQRQADAQEAVKQADQAAQKNSPDLARKADDAAKALQRLADQLQGKESDAEKADRLAKKQKNLADEADKLATKPDAKAQSDLKQQQQRLQDEARQVRGGEEAAREKQKADDALAQLSRAQPDKMPEAQRQAADALKNLADRLGEKSQAQALTPQQLAQQQRQLTQQTQQARQDAGKQNAQQNKEALQQLARQQAQLSRQAERTQNNQPQAMQQARQAMNQAEQSLAKGDWEKAQQNQQQAAKALEQMSQQANNQRQAPARQQQQAANMPNRNQVDQARELAQQQRDLRDEVQRRLGQQQAAQNQQPMNNPLGELAREQQSIADAARQMARQQAQQNGQQAQQTQQAQQAAKAAEQAARQLQTGAAQQAKQSGQQAAQQMRQMAQNGQSESRPQAQQLAQRQEAVNRQLEQMGNSPQSAQAQQRAQQQNLQQQTQQLTKEMQQQANQTRNPSAQQSMQQASQASQQANQAMQQAQRSQQQGNQPGTQQSQQQAAQNLDRAAQMARQAAQQGQSQQGQQQTGQALEKAQNQMGNAQRQLGQRGQEGARESMQNAAQSLQQAAQSLAQQQGQQGQPPNRPTPTGQNDGSAANAIIDLARYGADARKFQGKPWGELPGELRTRIIQDMKAQFGDDYGRMIKLYFEQLADKK
jgi:hypothetical protein